MRRWRYLSGRAVQPLVGDFAVVQRLGGRMLAFAGGFQQDPIQGLADQRQCSKMRPAGPTSKVRRRQGLVMLRVEIWGLPGVAH